MADTKDQAVDPLDATFPADWLMEQHFPPLRYVVEGVIPEGFSLIVAPPKFGKSWLMLGLGLAISTGGLALGHIPTGMCRPVLYAALEDGPRRLQSRITTLDPEEVPDTLMFLTTVRRDDILTTLQAFVDRWQGHEPVIILDTLGKAMPPAIAGESSYERDYRVGGMLKAIADSAPGAAVLVVHHTRKADASDFLDAVSGTQGLAGSADTIVVLSRERMSQDATLRVTSRDAAEGEYGIRLDGVGKWVLAGGSLQEAAKQARASAGVGDKMTEIIDAVARHPEGIKPRDLKVLVSGVGNVDEYLRRAVEAGRIEKLSRGLYGPVRSVRSVSFGSEAETHNSHNSHTHTPGEVIAGPWGNDDKGSGA